MGERNSSDSACTNSTTLFQNFICKCYSEALGEAETELTSQQRDYLRQNVMVPLTWAMARALNYEPTDPIHYIAYQLLRWSTGSVFETEKENIQEFVACVTACMDEKLA